MEEFLSRNIIMDILLWILHYCGNIKTFWISKHDFYGIKKKIIVYQQRKHVRNYYETS